MTDNNKISVPTDIHIICGIFIYFGTSSVLNSFCAFLLPDLSLQRTTGIFFNHILPISHLLIAYYLCRRNYIALIFTQLMGFISIAGRLFMILLSLPTKVRSWSLQLLIFVSDKSLGDTGWSGYIYSLFMIGLSLWIIYAAQKHKSSFSSPLSDYEDGKSDDVSPGRLSSRSKRVLLLTTGGTILFAFVIGMTAHFLLPDAYTVSVFSCTLQIFIAAPSPGPY